LNLTFLIVSSNQTNLLFTYASTISPKITSVSPDNGFAGDLITIQAIFSENPSKINIRLTEHFFPFDY
jgi:hypothetical protein